MINEDSRSPDFLQQNLDSVYTYTDPRSYPLSSYSYLIVPRAGTHAADQLQQRRRARRSAPSSTTSCAPASSEVAALGYSPLPLNLVQGGLLQSYQDPRRTSRART